MHHHGRPDGQLQLVGDLLVGRHHLLPADVAAQVAAARGDVLVETGQGLDEALGGPLRGDERAASLDPLDHPLGLELGQRLPHHRAGDVVGAAELVVAGQPVAGGELTRRADRRAAAASAGGRRAAASCGRSRRSCARAYALTSCTYRTTFRGVSSDDVGPSVVLVTSRSFSTGDLDLAGELTAAGCRIVTGPPDHDLDRPARVLASATAWIAGTGPVIGRPPRRRAPAAARRPVRRRRRGGRPRRRGRTRRPRHQHPGCQQRCRRRPRGRLDAGGLLRDVAAGDRAVRGGDWQRPPRPASSGRLTVGIVGLGRIGRGVAARLRGFGTHAARLRPLGPPPSSTRARDRRRRPGRARPPQRRDHPAPARRRRSSSTPAFLDLVRPSAMLVNTARASLVDESAVADALRTDRLRGYAADVLGSEAGAAENPLLADDLADRTLFTPHAAAQTVEAVDQMGRGAVDAVLALLRGERAAEPRPLPPGGDRMTDAAESSRPGRPDRAAAATVIAVLRAPTAAAAVAATDALVAGGVTGIEITYSTPDAAAVIREVRERHGDAVYLGRRHGADRGPGHRGGRRRRRVPGQPRHRARRWPRPCSTPASPCSSGAYTPSEVMVATGLGVTWSSSSRPRSAAGLPEGAARAVPRRRRSCPTGGVNPDNLGRLAGRRSGRRRSRRRAVPGRGHAQRRLGHDHRHGAASSPRPPRYARRDAHTA